MIGINVVSADAFIPLDSGAGTDSWLFIGQALVSEIRESILFGWKPISFPRLGLVINIHSRGTLNLVEYEQAAEG
jgi:hypothetical protein